jgi:hypothetical protein
MVDLAKVNSEDSEIDEVTDEFEDVFIAYEELRKWDELEGETSFN